MLGVRECGSESEPMVTKQGREHPRLSRIDVVQVPYFSRNAVVSADLCSKAVWIDRTNVHL